MLFINIKRKILDPSKYLQTISATDKGPLLLPDFTLGAGRQFASFLFSFFNLIFYKNKCGAAFVVALDWMSAPKRKTRKMKQSPTHASATRNRAHTAIELVSFCRFECNLTVTLSFHTFRVHAQRFFSNRQRIQFVHYYCATHLGAGGEWIDEWMSEEKRQRRRRRQWCWCYCLCLLFNQVAQIKKHSTHRCEFI